MHLFQRHPDVPRDFLTGAGSPLEGSAPAFFRAAAERYERLMIDLSTATGGEGQVLTCFGFSGFSRRGLFLGLGGCLDRIGCRSLLFLSFVRLLPILSRSSSYFAFLGGGFLGVTYFRRALLRQSSRDTTFFFLAAAEVVGAEAAER